MIVFSAVIISTRILVHSVHEAYSESELGLIIKKLFVTIRDMKSKREDFLVEIFECGSEEFHFFPPSSHLYHANQTFLRSLIACPHVLPVQNET